MTGMTGTVPLLTMLVPKKNRQSSATHSASMVTKLTAKVMIRGLCTSTLRLHCNETYSMHYMYVWVQLISSCWLNSNTEIGLSLGWTNSMLY